MEVKLVKKNLIEFQHNKKWCEYFIHKVYSEKKLVKSEVIGCSSYRVLHKHKRKTDAKPKPPEKIIVY